MDAVTMPDNVQPLRAKAPDTEKITVNLGYVDLGQIDLMVQEGFYSNRTDFIRTAIRNQLDRHGDVVKQSTLRHSLDLGLRNFSRAAQRHRGSRRQTSTNASAPESSRPSPARTWNRAMASRWVSPSGGAAPAAETSTKHSAPSWSVRL